MIDPFQLQTKQDDKYQNILHYILKMIMFGFLTIFNYEVIRKIFYETNNHPSDITQNLNTYHLYIL